MNILKVLWLLLEASPSQIILRDLAISYVPTLENSVGKHWNGTVPWNHHYH
jgi:hypothetical protein